MNGMINERCKVLYFSMCLWSQLEISSLPNSLNTESGIEFGPNNSGFFFLILNLNCFLKILLGLIRTKLEQLHPQLSLNWNWPKIDTASTSQLTDEVLHVLTPLEHCRTKTSHEIWIEPGLSCDCSRVSVLLYRDALLKDWWLHEKRDSFNLRIGHLI